MTSSKIDLLGSVNVSYAHQKQMCWQSERQDINESHSYSSSPEDTSQIRKATDIPAEWFENNSYLSALHGQDELLCLQVHRQIQGQMIGAACETAREAQDRVFAASWRNPSWNLHNF